MVRSAAPGGRARGRGGFCCGPPGPSFPPAVGFFFGGANSGRISDRLPVPPLNFRRMPSPRVTVPEKPARVEPARSEPFTSRSVSPSADRSVVTSSGRSSPREERTCPTASITPDPRRLFRPLLSMLCCPL